MAKLPADRRARCVRRLLVACGAMAIALAVVATVAIAFPIAVSIGGDIARCRTVSLTPTLVAVIACVLAPGLALVPPLSEQVRRLLAQVLGVLAGGCFLIWGGIECWSLMISVGAEGPSGAFAIIPVGAFPFLSVGIACVVVTLSRISVALRLAMLIAVAALMTVGIYACSMIAYAALCP